MLTPVNTRKDFSSGFNLIAFFCPLMTLFLVLQTHGSVPGFIDHHELWKLCCWTLFLPTPRCCLLSFLKRRLYRFARLRRIEKITCHWNFLRHEQSNRVWGDAITLKMDKMKMCALRWSVAASYQLLCMRWNAVV